MTTSMLRESGKPARQRTSAFFSRVGRARTERNVSIIAIPLLHSVIVSFEQKNLGYLAKSAASVTAADPRPRLASDGRDPVTAPCQTRLARCQAWILAGTRYAPAAVVLEETAISANSSTFTNVKAFTILLRASATLWFIRARIPELTAMVWAR
jgi:hypothetical protein